MQNSNRAVISILLLGFALLFFAYKQYGADTSKKQNDESEQTTDAMTENEYTLKTRFNSFDTAVDVLFIDTKDFTSEIQRKNYEGFIIKQDSLTPEILRKVFEYYKDSYPNYRKGWTMVGTISNEELEKYLPTPTTPENLKPFITPVTIYIQNTQNCTEGSVGIEFECTWDIENGLGVLIKNWEVKEVSLAQIVYFQ